MPLFQRLGYFSLLALTLIPLVYSNEYSFGMSVPRVLVTWTIIVFLGLSACIIIWNKKSITFKYSNLTIGLFVYFGLLVVSGIFAKSSYLSFFSNFERMDGILNFGFLFLFFLLFSNLKFYNFQWVNFAKLSIVISIIISFTAIYQHIRYPLLRSSGTLGNPLSLAFYLEFHIFLGIIYLLNLTESKNNIGGKALIVCIILIQLFAIVCTGSRSPFVSLAIGVFVIICYLFFQSKSIRKQVFISGLVLALISIGGILFLKNSNILNRITDFSFKDQSSLARLELWKISINQFIDYPLIGCGKENFIYFFTKYYNNNLGESGDWFDRSHNFLLDKLVEGGILGLIAYLLFLGFIFINILKCNINSYLKASLLGIFVTYIIFHLFNFETVPSNIILFIFIVFISQNTDNYQKIILNIKKPLIAAVVLFLLFISYLFIWKTLNTYNNLNRLKTNTINLEKNKEYFEAAIIGKFDLVIALALKRLDLNQSQENQDLSKAFLNQTISDINQTLINYPEHPILLSQLGFIQMANGMKKDAINTYEKLKILSPNRHVNLMDLGNLYLSNKQFDNALLEFDQVYKMDTTYKLALVNKAYCLSVMANYIESNKTLEKLSVKSTIANLDKCTEVYRLNNNYNGLLFKLSNSNFNADPDYTPNTFLRWVQIAAIQKNNPEIEKAIITYLKYFYIDYDKNEIQKLITSIQTGKQPPEAFYKKFESIWW